MNDLNRNTRTLIVSFVVAIMFLVPLRFVEVGQEQSNLLNNSQVLGEVSEVKSEARETVKLEEPYDKLDGQGCVDKLTLSELEKNVSDELQKSLSADDKLKLLEELREKELNACE